MPTFNIKNSLVKLSTRKPATWVKLLNNVLKEIRVMRIAMAKLVRSLTVCTEVKSGYYKVGGGFRIRFSKLLL